MTRLFAADHDTDASQLRASGRRCICHLLPSELLGDTWASKGSRCLMRHPELLHRHDSAPPTKLDNEQPAFADDEAETILMTAAEIAEVFSREGLS